MYLRKKTKSAANRLCKQKPDGHHRSRLYVQRRCQVGNGHGKGMANLGKNSVTYNYEISNFLLRWIFVTARYP